PDEASPLTTTGVKTSTFPTRIVAFSTMECSWYKPPVAFKMKSVMSASTFTATLTSTAQGPPTWALTSTSFTHSVIPLGWFGEVRIVQLNCAGERLNHNTGVHNGYVRN